MIGLRERWHRLPAADSMPAPPEAAMPYGVSIKLDADTVEIEPGVLYGGSPARLLRLSDAGRLALQRLRAGPVDDAATALLARRLTDGGLADPVPPPVTGPIDVTVVVPVRDRPVELARCLAALGVRHPVLVVDDGSADPRRTEQIASEWGARVVRHPANRGPAAARNTALALVDTEWVAFVDSDCVPSADWVRRLAAHLVDPAVVAVAPRIIALGAGRSAASRYAVARSPLDLGPRAARVAPMSRVSYVPTAALLVRRAPLADGFDAHLRVGEDVDLVWRLLTRGWRIRYEPSVTVQHAEPSSWRALLARRATYGTSAAPLSRRHPGQVAPLVLQPWPTLVATAVLARRPLAAAVAFSAGSLLLVRRLAELGIPARGVLRPMAGGAYQTWLGMGRWAVQFAAPALLAGLVHPGGADPRTRWLRRASWASLLVGPAAVEWRRRQPELDPVRFAAGVLADDMAYGAGVWRGCLRERLFTPLLPRIVWAPVRRDNAR